MKWMSTPSIVGHELRQGVELRLGLAPVVFGPPVAHELLQLGELYALRPVTDRLPVGPPRRGDAPAQIDELLFRNVDAEGADRVVSGCCGRLAVEEAESNDRC